MSEHPTYLFPSTLSPEMEQVFFRVQERALAAVDERWRNSYDSFVDKKAALRAWHNERGRVLRTLAKIRKALEKSHDNAR